MAFMPERSRAVAPSGGKRSLTGILPPPITTPWCAAGRKPLVQFMEPPAGSPRESGSTTKVGRFSLRLPNPYESHEPRHGKPFMVKQVFIKNVAGVWFELLDVMEYKNV